MLFNSPEFLFFLPLSLALYYLTKRNLTLQNGVLLVLSYFFYACWDYRFLSLIILSTFVDYYVALAIAGSQDKAGKKKWLMASVVFNLGLLGFFKYYNFFNESFVHLMASWGFSFNTSTLNIILPVGISFYTFQTMSYTIDVYRGQLKPTRNFLAYACYVAFFPQLVAGPIERAHNFLPQFQKSRHTTYKQLTDGAYLILWGMFCKVFVADNLAELVDATYNQPAAQNGVIVFLATIAFAFQILADFSGYTNIARGTSKLMGFEIMINFKSPYFSKNPSEFWQRWHISLSSWLKDYLYIPLGGNQKPKSRTLFNLMTTMLLGGLWHGANWTFVLWGFYHGCLLVGYRLLEFKKAAEQAVLKSVKSLAQILVMFVFILMGWMIFRANSIADVFVLGSHIAAWLTGAQSIAPLYLFQTVFFLFFHIWPLLLINAIQWVKDQDIPSKRWPFLVRLVWYLFLFYGAILFGNFQNKEFIYFRF